MRRLNLAGPRAPFFFFYWANIQAPSFYPKHMAPFFLFFFFKILFCILIEIL
jgi:hypothetical protein